LNPSVAKSLATPSHRMSLWAHATNKSGIDPVNGIGDLFAICQSSVKEATNGEVQFGCCREMD
jgi:hypothetical protein